MKISEAKRSRLFSLIEQQQSSNLGVAEFCQRHRIKKWTFWYWRRKLAMNGQEKEDRSIALKKQEAAFYPVSCSPMEKTFPGEGIEIRYPSGIQVTFPSSFDIASLRQFILSGES